MAKGLYAQMSCTLPDKPEIIDAGPDCELVYYRAILRCRDNLTDGVIDRRRVARWFAGIRGRPKAHLDRLVEVGLLEPHPDGWRIPLSVWIEWNPTREEVDAKREAESERKRLWRERQRDEAATESRQHRDNGTSASATDTRRDRDEHATDSQSQSHSQSTKSSNGSGTPRRTDKRCSEAITEHIASLGNVRSPGGLRRTIERDEGPALAAWFTEHPDATALDGARAVLGTPKPAVDSITGVNLSPHMSL